MKLSSPETRAGHREWFVAVWLFLIAIGLGSALRLTQLDARPMHTDESTQAVKFGQLLNGTYEYDPTEHHGPTLLYATLPLKWFTGTGSFAEMTETKLRLAPALVGLALILLLPFISDGLGKLATGWAAFFLALSPIFVFYSRYYIMEMLLVLFTFTAIACGWRFVRSRRPFWLVGCAASFGLMHATKETFVLHVAAMAGAIGTVLILRFFTGGVGTVNRNRPERLGKRHFLTFILVAAAVSAFCFTQGFTHLRGVVDSIRTYFSYANRAGGQGHEKPWFYYLQLLWHNHGGTFWLSEKEGGFSGGKFCWTESTMLLLAFAGVVRAFLGRVRSGVREFAIFLSVYAFLNFLAYSCIAYKTPWCILSAHHALILLAGFGAAGIAGLFESKWGRAFAGLVFVAMGGHLALQAYRANFNDNPAAPRWLQTRNTHSSKANPYAYGYTPINLRDGIVARIEGYASRSPAGKALRIDVASPGGGWPLPWYLRQYSKIGWWPAVNYQGKMRIDPNADVILVAPGMAAELPESVRGADGNGSADFAKDIFGLLNEQFYIQGYVKRSLLPPEASVPPPIKSEPKTEPQAAPDAPKTNSPPPTEPTEPEAPAKPETPPSPLPAPTVPSLLPAPTSPPTVPLEPLQPDLPAPTNGTVPLQP